MDIWMYARAHDFIMKYRFFGFFMKWTLVTVDATENTGVMLKNTLKVFYEVKIKHETLEGLLLARVN